MNQAPRRWAVLVVATAVILAGCSSGDDAADAPTTTATPAPSATEPPAASSDPEDGTEVVDRDADLDLPRTMTYAGVDISVIAATFSNATPSTVANDEPQVGDDELLYLELATVFVEGYPGANGLFNVDDFAIVTVTGDEIVGRGADNRSEVPVRDGSTSTAFVAFEATSDDLDGASLVLDDGEHERSEVPLTDDVPDAVYPIRTEVGTTSTAGLKSGCDPVPAQVELVATEWDVDGGVGVDDERLIQGETSRVDAGERFVRAELSVTAGAGQCGGTFLVAVSARRVDGARRRGPRTPRGTCAPPRRAPGPARSAARSTAPAPRWRRRRCGP